MANPTAPAASTANTMPAITSRPVAAAPPVRSRPARPEKRPEIKLSAAKEESRFVGPLPLAVGMLALVATLGFAHRLLSKTEDANYVLAAESLRQYEIGKTETEKNYDSSIYTDALASLAKVAPKSISGDKAAALIADINFKTDAFHRRIRERDEAQRALQASRDNRNAAYLAARARDLVMPQKDFPECNEGKGSHAH